MRSRPSALSAAVSAIYHALLVHSKYFVKDKWPKHVDFACIVRNQRISTGFGHKKSPGTDGGRCRGSALGAGRWSCGRRTPVSCSIKLPRFRLDVNRNRDRDCRRTGYACTAAVCGVPRGQTGGPSLTAQPLAFRRTLPCLSRRVPDRTGIRGLPATVLGGEKGLEPSRLSTPVPQTGAATVLPQTTETSRIRTCGPVEFIAPGRQRFRTGRGLETPRLP